MAKVTLHLANGRTITGETNETPEQFALRWKEALKNGEILILGADGDREYVNPSQVVSVR